MSEVQKKQYMEFIESFVLLMYENKMPRETTIEAGLSALSAFVGTICELPEDDEGQTPFAEFTTNGLVYAIQKTYDTKAVPHVC